MRTSKEVTHKIISERAHSSRRSISGLNSSEKVLMRTENMGSNIVLTFWGLEQKTKWTCFMLNL